ncbi:hypothetical protein IMSHALPRED_007232, partial [Imshaugia aleurites]
SASKAVVSNSLTASLMFFDDEQKFRNWSKVYVQGRGNEVFKVLSKYKCDFYNLEDCEGRSTCMGRYGKESPMMYREEELSKTPWIAGKPPMYESSSSGGFG